MGRVTVNKWWIQWWKTFELYKIISYEHMEDNEDERGVHPKGMPYGVVTNACN